MAVEPIRIGIVGAGNVVRQRYITGFRAFEDVEIVSVCNSTPQSSQRVASEHEIANVYDTWLELVEAEDTNAILVGTYADLHCPVFLAALENGKHVLTETSVSRNAEEAHAMLEAARACPDLVAQAIPSAFSYQVEPTLQELIQTGYLGEILAIDMRLHLRSFVDLEGPYRRRSSWEVNGYNVSLLSGWYQCLMRWVGPAFSLSSSQNSLSLLVNTLLSMRPAPASSPIPAAPGSARGPSSSLLRLSKKESIRAQYSMASLTVAAVSCSSSTIGCHERRKNSASCCRGNPSSFSFAISGSMNRDVDWNLNWALCRPTTLAIPVIALMSNKWSSRDPRCSE